MQKIFWIAGENSGDLHASQVMGIFRKRHPEMEHFGIGGPRMAAEGLRQIEPFGRFAVMGFIEVIKHLPFFMAVEQRIDRLFREETPSLVVLVDYPGLNMRIAEKATLYGIPVLYYISPQFWAWKEHRVVKLRKFTQHVACILPFEQALLEKAHVPCSYVGHPIAEEIRIQSTRESFAEKYGLDMGKKWISFFPGSRNNEVKRILPSFFQTMDLLLPEKFEFLVSKATSVSDTLFHQLLSPYASLNIRVIEQDNYAMMKHSDFLCVTSGTATLEAAYIGTPFLIVYRAQQLSYELGKRFIRIKRIGLPNIILDDDIAPELIQDQVNPHEIRKWIDYYLQNPEAYQTFTEKLTYLHELLGTESASENTSDLMEKLLRKKIHE